MPAVASAAMKRFGKKLFSSIGQFRRDQMTYHAGSLTAYGLLSLFPFLLLAVAILGIASETATTERILSYLRSKDANREILQVTSNALNLAVEREGAAREAFGLGVAILLYGASSALNAAGRALNIVFDLDERRGYLKRRGFALLEIAPLIALTIAAYFFIFIGGEVARDLFRSIGINESFDSIWEIIRWPLSAALAVIGFSFVYWRAPDHRNRRWREFLPGALLGVVLWLIGSIGFYIFITNFRSLNATYGTFAGAVLLIFWIWVSNVAFLLGAEWCQQTFKRARDITGERSPDEAQPEGELGDEPPVTAESHEQSA